MTRSPISPKAHGAWLGAGAGAYAANIVVGLLQAYVTHKTLPAADVQLVYGVVPPSLAFFGAWLLPLLPASMVKDVGQLAPLLKEIPAQPQAQQATGSASWPAEPIPAVKITGPVTGGRIPGTGGGIGI